MDESSIYVSLDVGTSSVKVLVGQMDGATLHVIGVGDVPSKGVRKGIIVDIDATVESIREAVSQAEQMTGITIHEVILGIPANDIQLQKVKGVVAVSSENREITDHDLERVIDSAQVMSVSPDREIVNMVPKQFILDDYDEIEDPRGMKGVRLETEGMLITSSQTLIHNVLRCVERAGLQIKEIYLQPLAAGHFALTEDEKNHRAAYVDIGGGTTTVSVFEDHHLKSTSVIPIGGEHVTKDLSIVLQTPTEEARKIQYHYGHAFADDASENEVFEVPIISSSEKREHNQKEIAQIIEARIEEIFEYVLQELYDMGVQDLPGGIILTGGTTKLQGILPLAMKVLKTRVRIHVPQYIGVREPMYTTAVGLIQYDARQDEFFNRSVSSPVPAEEEYYEDDEYYEAEEEYYEYDENEEDHQSRKREKPKFVDKMKRYFSTFFD